MGAGWWSSGMGVPVRAVDTDEIQDRCGEEYGVVRMAGRV